MVVILGICWGGFIGSLVFGMLKQERRREAPDDEGAAESSTGE